MPLLGPVLLEHSNDTPDPMADSETKKVKNMGEPQILYKKRTGVSDFLLYIFVNEKYLWDLDYWPTKQNIRRRHRLC